MSETRAVAVLLWLFELVRKGPRLKRGMRALWWGATIYLCLLVQSVVLLVLHGILLFLGNAPLINDNQILFGMKFGVRRKIPPSIECYWDHPLSREPQALLLAPFFVLFMVASCHMPPSFPALFRKRMEDVLHLGGGACGDCSLRCCSYYGIDKSRVQLWVTAFSLPIKFHLIAVAAGSHGMGFPMRGTGRELIITSYVLAGLLFFLF